MHSLDVALQHLVSILRRLCRDTSLPLAVAHRLEVELPPQVFVHLIGGDVVRDVVFRCILCILFLLRSQVHLSVSSRFSDWFDQQGFWSAGGCRESASIMQEGEAFNSLLGACEMIALQRFPEFQLRHTSQRSGVLLLEQYLWKNEDSKRSKTHESPAHP